MAAMKPTPLPDRAEREARRARRRQQVAEQDHQAAPWPPPELSLPSDEALEQASRKEVAGA